MGRGAKIAIVLLALFVAQGIAFIWYNGRRYADAAAWPTVEGRVIESGLGRSGGTGRSASTFHPYVAYEYVVGGRRYRGDEIWLTSGILYNDEEEAAAFLRPYAVGSPVRVHYDPEDPNDTALILSNDDPLVLFTPLAALAIVVIVVWSRSRRREARKSGVADVGPPSRLDAAEGS